MNNQADSNLAKHFDSEDLGFWRTLLAYLIDGIIIWLLNFGLFLLVNPLLIAYQVAKYGFFAGFTVGLLENALVALIYYFGFRLSKYQQTIGEILLKPSKN